MDVQSIIDSISEKTQSDGSIDRIRFIEQTDNIQQIANFLYGFVTTVILLVVPLVIAMEVIYICFPFIRDKFDKLLIKVESKGTAKKVIGLALRDAKAAVYKANTTQTGESALYLYLIIKCKSMMFIMFIICMVLKGTSPIIMMVWTMIKNILNNIWHFW